ncbi:ubiquinone anaerobic biosynthesis accessory factor UbiT [Bauldia litoralis]
MLLGAVVRRHPRIFDRLGEYSQKQFGIEATDLPFAFILEPRPDAPRMVAVRKLPAIGIDARISGTLAALVALADGTCDGDALFFSRDLEIEGDIEAIVALRNAIDDSGVDILRDTTADLGPFGPPFASLIRFAVAKAEGLPAAAGGQPWN